MISAHFARISFPWFVMISKAKGRPSFSRTPSPFKSFQPASASSAFAFAGS